MVSMNKNYQFTEKILENVKDYLALVLFPCLCDAYKVTGF